MNRFQRFYLGLWDTWRLVRMNLSINQQLNVLNLSATETAAHPVPSAVDVAGSLQKLILRYSVM